MQRSWKSAVSGLSDVEIMYQLGHAEHYKPRGGVFLPYFGLPINNSCPRPTKVLHPSPKAKVRTSRLFIWEEKARSHRPHISRGFLAKMHDFLLHITRMS